jgi:hypothetical protein
VPQSNYAVFRYQIFDDADAIDLSSHFDAFDDLKGKPAPYRIRDPEGHDFKNFIFDLQKLEIDGVEFFSFGVGYQITERPEQQYDDRTEKISLVMRDANDMRYTRGVFVPAIGASAFKDGSGNQLNASGGIGRVKAIFESHSEMEFHSELTASKTDVASAIKNLDLVEMKFTVRPFNPHPSNPGIELDKLLRTANVGKLTATAKPFDGGNLSPSDGGLVSEAQGLVEKGYGQSGITANTSDGATVKYKPKPFSGDKEKDQATEEKPRLLHVSVEKEPGNEPAEEKRIVSALIEIFKDEQ